MRLLSIDDDGGYSLTSFIGNTVPTYAILSHTWEPGNQEVTFQDFINGTGKAKSGYRKIQFCGERARADGFQYFWVDSCCIDKTSSTELSEAINSMYRWYRKAAKCYVYLSDLSTEDAGLRPQSSAFLHEDDFKGSRWFRRGWTLQELLAPSTIEFYSRQGKFLGDKISLESQIHEATHLPLPAIQGQSLSQFTLRERILWMEGRETTVEEDFAYCMLGILDTHIPLLYGEGVESAFFRLFDEVHRRSRVYRFQHGNISTPKMKNR